MKLWVIGGLLATVGLGAFIAISGTPTAEAEGTRLGDVYAAAQKPEANISIGQPFELAKQSLLDSDFVAVNPMSDGCSFQRDEGDTVKITLSTGDGRCEEGKTLAFIRYTRTERQAQPDAETELKLLTNGMGVDGSCRLVTARTVFCTWNDPQAYRDLVKVDLAVQGRVTNVSLRTYVGADSKRIPIAESIVDANGKSAPSPDLGAFDPRASIRELDPRAPNGVRIGAPLKEVAEMLLGAGFTTPDGGRLDKIGCGWRFRRNNEVDVRIDLRAEITVNGVSRSNCIDGAVIKNISFNKTDSRPTVVAQEQSPTETIERWRIMLGASKEGEECNISQDGIFQREQCTWTTVTAVPVSYATVTHHLRGEKSASVALVLSGVR